MLRSSSPNTIPKKPTHIPDFFSCSYNAGGIERDQGYWRFMRIPGWCFFVQPNANHQPPSFGLMVAILFEIPEVEFSNFSKFCSH